MGLEPARVLFRKERRASATLPISPTTKGNKPSFLSLTVCSPSSYFLISFTLGCSFAANACQCAQLYYALQKLVLPHKQSLNEYM